MNVVAPRVSTASSRRTSALRPAITWAPRARESVTVGQQPLGHQCHGDADAEEERLACRTRPSSERDHAQRRTRQRRRSPRRPAPPGQLHGQRARGSLRRRGEGRDAGQRRRVAGRRRRRPRRRPATTNVPASSWSPGPCGTGALSPVTIDSSSRRPWDDPGAQVGTDPVAGAEQHDVARGRARRRRPCAGPPSRTHPQRGRQQRPQPLGRPVGAVLLPEREDGVEHARRPTIATDSWRQPGEQREPGGDPQQQREQVGELRQRDPRRGRRSGSGRTFGPSASQPPAPPRRSLSPRTARSWPPGMVRTGAGRGCEGRRSPTSGDPPGVCRHGHAGHGCAPGGAARPGRPASAVERPVPRPAPGEVLVRVRRVRGVPHRPAPRRRRPARRGAGVRPRPRGGRRGGRARAAAQAGSRSVTGSGIAWLRRTCGALPVVPDGAREPLPGVGVHRLGRRRRLRRVRRRARRRSPTGCPTASPTSRRRRCCARGSSATARCVAPRSHPAAAWGSTASGRARTSPRRSRSRRAPRCTC